ncbi:hypothetical protein N9009_01800, partial [bacterium]|nr:hypothetical protein [bacterium]
PLTNKINTTPVHSQFDDSELPPHQIKEHLNTETLETAESTSLGNHERFPLEEFSPQDIECEEQSTDQGQENKNQLTQLEIGNFSIESLYDQGERILGAPTIATLRNWLDWYSRNEDAITDPDQEILLEIRADEIDDQLREMKRKSTPDLTYPRALQSRESNQAQPSTLLTEPNPTYDPSKTPAELIEELVEQLADCLSNQDPTASPEPFVQLIKNFAVDPMQLSSSTRPVVDLIFKQKKILSDLSETDACKWASTESKKFLENVEKNFYQS